MRIFRRRLPIRLPRRRRGRLLLLILLLLAVLLLRLRWFPAIRDLAARYFCILYTPMLFRAATVIFGTVLRAAGDTRTPMRVGAAVNLINVALNFLNKQKVRSALSFESISDSLERKVGDDPWFNGNELELELSKAIQRLPQKQKVVFCLRYYQELSYEEISSRTGINYLTLRVLLSQARSKLKKMI